MTGDSEAGPVRCDNCGHEGEPESADYYGTEIAVCENCGAEVDR